MGFDTGQQRFDSSGKTSGGADPGVPILAQHALVPVTLHGFPARTGAVTVMERRQRGGENGGKPLNGLFHGGFS